MGRLHEQAEMRGLPRVVLASALVLAAWGAAVVPGGTAVVRSGTVDAGDARGVPVIVRKRIKRPKFPSSGGGDDEGEFGQDEQDGQFTANDDGSFSATDGDGNGITTDEDGESSVSLTCFPADATVLVEHRGPVTMDALALGDRVLVAAGVYSPVFMFTHRIARGRFPFVTLSLSSGGHLDASAGHYIYINGALAPASTARVGDTLELADRALATVAAVTTGFKDGLFNPQTTHGDIVVNGVRASTYTTAVAPAAAHGLLAPVRAAFRLGVTFVGLESGAPRMFS